MSSAPAKSVPKSILGAIASVVAFFITWFLFSALFTFIGHSRDEGFLWNFAMKDIVAPGAAGYIAFEAVERMIAAVDWRIVFGFFLVSVIALVSLNLAFSSEFYLTRGRDSDWHIALVSTILSAVAAGLGAFIFCRKRWLS